MKTKNKIQQDWRIKKTEKLWQKIKFHLTKDEIIKIKKLRKDWETLQYIANLFNRSIEWIRKHTI